MRASMAVLQAPLKVSITKYRPFLPPATWYRTLLTGTSRRLCRGSVDTALQPPGPAYGVKHLDCVQKPSTVKTQHVAPTDGRQPRQPRTTCSPPCLLYTSDAADEEDSGDLGRIRIFKQQK
eukprot:TRINITY_DN9280_c0_g1_i1.p1 TRINITY_DN9280_c0_g1~~TRINITY_DN9280_c0_g1_i1.p1  ORF type:complete len:121 (+),score=5.98 TRINITY_DN9280_c0_g1_i1:275-637(+)